MSMTQRYAGMLRRHAAEWDKQGLPVQAEATRQAARHMEERERELIAEVARAVEAERAKFPNLMPVIQWLENGCDPKEAAKELRFYQAKHGGAR